MQMSDNFCVANTKRHSGEKSSKQCKQTIFFLQTRKLFANQLGLVHLARPTLAIKIQPGAAGDKYSLIPLFNVGKHSTYVHLNLNNYMRDYDKVNT